MSSHAFQRMRLQSHAYIKRQIAYQDQRLRLVSRRIDRQKSCIYNAHSAFLLCAVNPIGPCDTCLHYEPRSRRSELF